MEITLGILLLVIGFVSGAYGTIVGAGGGFIFVPALLLIMDYPPEVAAGTGLAVVLLNAISGVTGYVKQKRIHYKLGILLSIGAIPGTFLGIWLTNNIPATSFYSIFAALLIGLGLFLFIKKESKAKAEVATTAEGSIGKLAQTSNPAKANTLIACTGILLGIVSGFFGIGGGWLMVPILMYIFKIVPKYATATSIFALSLYSISGVIIYFSQGNIEWIAVLWGGAGIVFGAQLGVFLSNKISGKLTIRLLSVLLIIVGVRLFFG